MYPFNFLKAKREFIFYIRCGICIMRKLGVVVEPVIIIAESECPEPFYPYIFPVAEPFHLGTRLNKILHFHLFKFPHPEDELTCDYLIAECFAYLGNAERHLHPACFLYIKEVYKDPLCCFRTKVYLACS